MTAALLSVHVLAAILTIGPVAVAASMFPRYARQALTTPDAHAEAAVGVLHRITRVYAVIGIFVPVFGLATGVSLGVLTDAWLVVSVVLTAVAATLLAYAIIPAQADVLHALGASRLDPGRAARRLGMLTGSFNLLWAVVVVLMIVRPGSTTGAGL